MSSEHDHLIKENEILHDCLVKTRQLSSDNLNSVLIGFESLISACVDKTRTEVSLRKAVTRAKSEIAKFKIINEMSGVE